MPKYGMPENEHDPRHAYQKALRREHHRRGDDLVEPGRRGGSTALV